MEKVKLAAGFCWVVVMIVAGVSGSTTPITTPIAPCTDSTYGPGGGNCQPCGNCTRQPCNTRSGECRGGCLPGYKGSTCKQPCSNGRFGQDCISSCSPNCDSFPCDHVTGECICKPGFQEPDCVSACPGGFYGNCGKRCGYCKDGALCDKATGACTACKPGYKYSSSDRLCKTECDNGKYGAACNNNCNPNCATICDKETGICRCKRGYKPSTNCASECDNVHYGQNCTSACGSYCITPSDGGRKCDKSSGYCTCKVGYKTPVCTTQCAAGSYGQDCVERCGKCSAGSNTCNHATGACSRCVDNYEPPLCKVCLPGHWGYTCGQLCGHCGGDGRCDQLTGRCDSGDCLPGWTTASCDEKCPEGWYGLNCSQKCGSCSGKSTCRHDNGVCDLDCEDGYEGVLCKTEAESLVGPIVGSVMGAAILITLAIIGAACFLRRYTLKQKQPRTPEKDFPTLAELHTVQPTQPHTTQPAEPPEPHTTQPPEVDEDGDFQRRSQIYQNVDPAFNSNYDRVERRPHGCGVDEHFYDSQTALSTVALVNKSSDPPTSPHLLPGEKIAPQEDPVYQNSAEVVASVSVSTPSNKPRVAAKPPKAKPNKGGAARNGGDAYRRDGSDSAEPEATYGNV